MALQMPKRVDGKQFLVSEGRFVVVAHTLKFEVRMFIVDLTGPDIELDELIFDKPNSITLCRSDFLLLIRIINFRSSWPNHIL